MLNAKRNDGVGTELNNLKNNNNNNTLIRKANSKKSICWGSQNRKRSCSLMSLDLTLE